MSRYDAKANQSTRVLSDDEIRKIWAATEPNEKTPQPFHALVRFLLLTGAPRRRGRDHMARDNGIRLDAPGASKQSRG
jgi:hypothetical protein